MEARQFSLFAEVAPEPYEPGARERSATFLDNMKLPIHRWYRYSAGFSAEWVEEELREAQGHGPVTLLDPFAGAGTALVAAEALGVPAIGIEAHPFVYRIARAKLLWRVPVESFLERARQVRLASQDIEGTASGYPKLIAKCFPNNVLAELDALKRAWLAQSNDGPESELVWFAITAILRACSPAGTALWQYVLPKKHKANPASPRMAYEVQVRKMAADMRAYQRHRASPEARLFAADARTCDPVPDQRASLVITSPPYANNYDYAYAPLLEMAFWGVAEGWSDLREKVRKYLVRSCTQHVDSDGSRLDGLLDDPGVAPIRQELEQVCAKLGAERESHGGRKTYHLMVAAYFYDLAKVWTALRRVTRPGGRVCFVIGDSAPYGVYVPVDRWLGDLAVAAGFRSFQFEKLRDRNVKWRNRKHRVPLHEGRLWVEG